SPLPPPSHRSPYPTLFRSISSQCLKKHWRDSPGITELGDLADRSTRIYEQRVMQPLIDEHGASEDEALAIAQYLMKETVDTKPRSEEHTSELQSRENLVCR